MVVGGWSGRKLPKIDRFYNPKGVARAKCEGEEHMQPGGNGIQEYSGGKPRFTLSRGSISGGIQDHLGVRTGGPRCSIKIRGRRITYKMTARGCRSNRSTRLMCVCTDIRFFCSYLINLPEFAPAGGAPQMGVLGTRTRIPLGGYSDGMVRQEKRGVSYALNLKKWKLFASRLPLGDKFLIFAFGHPPPPKVTYSEMSFRATPPPPQRARLTPRL